MHRLTAAMLDQICAGAITPDTVEFFEKVQHSVRKVHLRSLLDQLADNPEAVGSLVEPEEAWRVLAAAEQQDSAAYDDLLRYPTVGVWLTRALHHTRRDQAIATPWPELGYLHLIAAAAAIRCGISCALHVPVWHGMVTLPTVGQIRLPGDFPTGTVELRCSAHRGQIHTNFTQATIDFEPGTPSVEFSPAKRHESTRGGLRLTAWIEDLDPYRRFGAPQPPGELDQPKLAEWRKLIDEAWDVLTLQHPNEARELSAGLRVLVPIDSDAGIAGASSPAAFGGIILSSNGSVIELAETMVHELQHSKLNALLSFDPLVRSRGSERYYAPWRDDPRPLTGLLHGLYAFTCAVEFWAPQRALLADTEKRHAEFSFTHRRSQLRLAMNQLSTKDILTGPGQRLLETLARRLEVLEHATVSSELSTIVDAMVADHHALWRHRSIRPDSSVVDALAEAWLCDAPAPAWSPGTEVMQGVHAHPLPNHRRGLLRTRATDPELFHQTLRQLEKLPGSTPRADAAFCLGEHDDAARSYRTRVGENLDDVQAWVGLGLAMRARGATAAARVILEAPEITLATRRRVRALGGASADPDLFATWLAAGL